MGLLLLTLIICGLALNSQLFIKIQLNLFALNGFVFVKLDKIANPMKNIFSNQSKYFHLY